MTNEIVAFPAMPPGPGAPPPAATVLVTGWDFVAAPRVSRDGRRLTWLAWNHPDMPWDSTELWVGDLVGVGSATRIEGARRIAGGDDESLVQPEWGPEGSLYVCSDRSDWWNVYRVDGVDELTPVYPVAAEVAGPAWVFGLSRYCVGDDGTVWMTYENSDGSHLVAVGADGGADDRLVPDVASLSQLRLDGDRIVAIADHFTREAEVVAFDLTNQSPADQSPAAMTILAPARDLGLDPTGISRPVHVTYATAGAQSAHAWYYPPTGVADGHVLVGPDAETPPLITMIHGGPTGKADPGFALATQFWTSRGFAVVQVNHRGSTGYGRAFRNLLQGAWGIVDVEDSAAAAQWLATQSLADPQRLAIRGGSAGGFTVLNALATDDTFSAGASYFGVADLAALARDTHKFESRYLDGLVGPWPAAAATYAQRSPLSRIDGFDCPLIVFQGLEDEVVPPSQSQMIVDALRAKGVPHAYLEFPGEQHGFRKAENIVRSLTAELYFYSKVFGFPLAEPVAPGEPVAIEFAERINGRSSRAKPLDL